MPRRDQIIANEEKIVTFTGSISKKFAGEIADVLLVNTSIRELSFKSTDLVDDCFKIIADALIKRNEKMKPNQKKIVLNVDNTNLTNDSIGKLQELMDNKIVRILLMYGIEGINEETQAGIDLVKYAKTNSVNISYDHPRKRAAIGFFDKNKDEQNDSANNDFSIKEQEIKTQHDNIQQNTSKKF